ncbi:hypothetical protein ANK1_4208 [plant metagenome]|uniref:Uncharacterized protein n=1 Tax=plant metagenome TaxID=1297885 RepID=A0A484Q2J8_9ZZZZ
MAARLGAAGGRDVAVMACPSDWSAVKSRVSRRPPRLHQWRMRHAAGVSPPAARYKIVTVARNLTSIPVADKKAHRENSVR